MTEDPADVVLGQRVSAARDRAGLSQQGLATAMTGRGHKWHQATVYKTEIGSRRLRVTELPDLAQELCTSVDALIANNVAAPREWPRTARLSPDANEVTDYLGHRWTQLRMDVWQSNDGRFTVPFWFLAEHYGPLKEVAS